jgi:hypothetical protein
VVDLLAVGVDEGEATVVEAKRHLATCAACEAVVAAAREECSVPRAVLRADLSRMRPARRAWRPRALGAFAVLASAAAVLAVTRSDVTPELGVTTDSDTFVRKGSALDLHLVDTRDGRALTATERRDDAPYVEPGVAYAVMVRSDAGFVALWGEDAGGRRALSGETDVRSARPWQGAERWPWDLVFDADEEERVVVVWCREPFAVGDIAATPLDGAPFELRSSTGANECLARVRVFRKRAP